MQDTLTIYGRPGCRYCELAKAMCEDLSVSYTYTDLSLDEEMKREFLSWGHTTVPQVYDGDRLIGGFTELRAELHGEG